MEKKRFENRYLQSRKWFEMGLIVVLLCHILILSGFKRFDVKTCVPGDYSIKQLDIIDIPVTKMDRNKPPPPKPTVPISSEDPELPTDIEIIFPPFNQPSTIVPPPPPDTDVPVFMPVEQMAEPVGGFSVIAENLIYPEIARLSGIEGRVIVAVYIDKHGNIISTKVMRSLGSSGCDEAAVEAIKAVKWKPAMQRDSPVKVWVAVPIDFKLTSR